MTMHLLLEHGDRDLVKLLRGASVEHEASSVRPWCKERGIRFIPVDEGADWAFTVIALDENQAFEFKMPWL